MDAHTHTHHPPTPFGRSLASMVTEDKKEALAQLVFSKQEREREKEKGVNGCSDAQTGQRAGREWEPG